MIKTLFKRSTIYLLGLILSKILSVVVFILFARALLPAKFGDFVLFVTLQQIVTFFADFGLNQWYQKKADFEEKKELLNKILTARIFTLVFSIPIAYLFLKFTFTFSQFISTVFLVSLLPEAFLSVFDGYYLEKGKSFKVALKTSMRMLVLLVGFLLNPTFTFELAAILYLTASILTLLWYFPWEVLSRFQVTSLKVILRTLKSSSSYAFLVFTSFFYARGDSLVVRYVLNNTALGIYGAAYRYLESLSLLPTALSHNLFPISAKKEGIAFAKLMSIFIISLLTGLIFSIALFIFADILILPLLGESYMQAIAILKIFSLVLLLFFLNAPLSTVIQSSKLLNSFLPWGIGNTLLNIFLNVLFVEKFGITAAAWVMATTEITGLVINIYFVRKIYQT